MSVRNMIAYGTLAVTDTYQAVEVGLSAGESTSEVVPGSGEIYEILVHFSSIAGGLVDADDISCKLSWTSTEDARNLSNEDAQDVLVTGTAGSVVFSLRSPFLKPSFATGLFVWLKLGRAGATATAKIYVNIQKTF